MIRWRLSKAAHQVIGWIIRDSWGWGRVWTRTPLDVPRIASSTGLHRVTVWGAFRSLKQHRFVSVNGTGRVRVNRSVLAGRFIPSTKLSSETATSKVGGAPVAKRRRYRIQKTTPALSNGYAQFSELQEQVSVAAPHRHVHTITDYKAKRNTASQYPASRGGLSNESKEADSKSAAPTSDQQSETKNPSLRQRLWSADCGEILSYWQRRFPSAKADHGLAGQIVTRCCDLSVSPCWLIDHVPLDHPNPRARLMGYLNHAYPLPEMADGERRAYSFHAWDTRTRAGVNQNEIPSLSEIMTGMTQATLHRREHSG